MKRDIEDLRVPITLIAIIAGAVIALMVARHANADSTPPAPGAAQYLMVDEEGHIVPEGYTLGIDQIASAAASVAAASNRVLAVQEATAASREVVSNLTEVLVGTASFGYIDGFVVSFGGAASVSTNATCQILQFEVEKEHTTVDGVPYSGHYITYYFTEPMNSVPYIKWKAALTDAEWNVVPLQDVTYLGTVTVNGRQYSEVYRSTAYTPSSLTQAFYLAYCEIAAADGDGSMLPIHGGITINGEVAYTGVVTNDNAVFIYHSGLLMSAPEAVAQ